MAGGISKWNGYVLVDPLTGQGATAGHIYSLWSGVVAAVQKINGLACQ